MDSPSAPPPVSAASGERRIRRSLREHFIRYPERNLAVDFLRGISILLVVFSHLNALRPLGESAFVPTGFLDRVRPNGALGVSIFFVISGYLITQNSLQRFGRLGAIRLRDFYTYRASRILPALLLLVAINLIGAAFVLWGFAIPHTIPIPKLLGYVFTFRFNLLYLEGAALLTAWAPLWSLAIEEVFYLSFPLVALLLRRTWLLVSLLVGLAIYGPIYRHQLGWGAFYLYLGCFDLLSVGCLTALASHHLKLAEWPVLRLRVLQALGATVLAGACLCWDVHDNGNWAWLPTVMALGASLFLLGSLGTTAGPATLAKRLAWPVGLAGFLSYELYLFHLPALLVLKDPLHRLSDAWHLPLPRDVVFLLFMVALMILTGLLHTWFSEPCLRFMRRRLAPARPAPAP